MGQALPSAKAVAADVNHDHIVDAKDVAAVEAYLLDNASSGTIGHRELVTYRDLTGDGQIDYADYEMVDGAVVGLASLTPLQRLAADVDANGQINSVDASYVKRHQFDRDVLFPARK